MLINRLTTLTAYPISGRVHTIAYIKLPTAEAYGTLIIYVDDMLLSGRHTRVLTELVRKLRFKFAMKDLGPARHTLGMKISRHRLKRQLFLS